MSGARGAALSARASSKIIPPALFFATSKLFPIRFRSGKSLLVAKNNAGGIIFELARADKAAPRAPLIRAGDGVLLRVSAKRSSRVLYDDVLVDPILQRCRRTRVDVALRGIARQNAALLDGDQVVRIGGVILLLHGRRNFVVRLGEHAIEGSALRIVAKGTKGTNLGHGVSGVNVSGMKALYFTRTARIRKMPAQKTAGVADSERPCIRELD